MSALNFVEVFKHIENDCKFLPSSKFQDYDKKELIVPLLFVSQNEIENNTKDYYIQRYIYEYNQIKSPSIITKFEIINDYIQNNNLFENYKIQRKFDYVNIEPEIKNINTDFTNVLKTVVIDMNVYSPIICGQFFENMVSLACNLDITQEFQPGNEIEEKAKDIENIIDNLKDNGEFKTVHHKNLAMCLYTQLKHGVDMTDYFIELINIREKLLSKESYIKRLDEYLQELKKTLICGFKNAKKSVKLYDCKDKFIVSGEADLVTDDAIIDIKCYKSEQIKLWKYQLEIYNNLLERKRNKMIIINLLNNKVYTWKITFDDMYNK